MREHVSRIAQSVRCAARGLTASPLFTLTAVMSLAVGIAATTTVFSVISSMLLRPLGTSHGLVRVGKSNPGERTFRSASAGEMEALGSRSAIFTQLSGHQIESATIGLNQQIVALSIEQVARGYFETVGAEPARGRSFSDTEHRTTASDSVVVISDRFWRRRLASDPSAIRQRVELDGRLHTIVGITPAGFTGTFRGVDVDMWRPARPETSLMLLGRLRSGLSLEAGEAELAGSSERHVRYVLAWAQGAHPLFAGVLRGFLALLMAVVCLILLMSCFNVASLLLTRARARQSEVAIRVALGASRAQIVELLLTESAQLALISGGVGLLLATGPIVLLNNLSFIPGPTGAGVFLDLRLDLPVLAFTVTLTVLTVLAVGIVPALRTSRIALASGLSRRERSSQRFSDCLIVIQVTASFVLLAGALLVVRSLHNAATMDVGFDPDRVTIASVDLAPLSYDRRGTDVFNAELLERARRLPGVEHAASGGFVPLSEGEGHPQPIRLLSPPSPRGGQPEAVVVGRITGSYFQTIGLPMVAGRHFSAGELLGTPRVVIVNQTMARQFGSDGDALGRRIGLGEGFPEHEVIGVVSDAHLASFRDTIEPLVFQPAQAARWLHLRSSRPPGELVKEVRALAREIDPDAAPHVRGESLRHHMASTMSLVPARILRLVLSAAGIVAVLLAVGGLYGVVSYAVERRMREVGIRIALGAAPVHVFALLTGRAVRLSALGIAFGAVIGAAAAQLLSAFLYGVTAVDPMSFGAVAATLALVTYGASYAAARKGIAANPLDVLRDR